MYLAPPVVTRNLDACLRDRHERLRAFVDEQIKKRKEKGIPLDDATDYAKLGPAIIRAQKASETMDGAEVRKALIEAMSLVAGGLEPLGEYVSNPDYATIDIGLRAVSEGRRLACREALGHASSASERFAVMRDYVADAIAHVDVTDGEIVLKLGGTNEARLNAGSLSALDDNDLIPPLFDAAVTYAEVEPAKKKLFGSLPPSTSEPIAATSAPRGTVDNVAVTAEHVKASTDSHSQTTPVLGGSSSSTHG